MLIKWLKKIISDVRTAVVSIIVLAIVGTVLNYLPYKNLWTFLKTTMPSPTPLWATTALVFVLLVYSYLKTEKLNQSFKSLPPKSRNTTNFKEMYELVKIGEGVHVFSLKTEYESSSMPSHYICPTCYNDNKESILVAEYTSPKESKYVCPKCHNYFVTNTDIRNGMFVVDD